MSSQQYLNHRVSHLVKSAPKAFFAVFLVTTALGVYTTLNLKPSTSLQVRVEIGTRIVTAGAESVPFEQPQVLWSKLKPQIISTQTADLILEHSFQTERSPAVLEINLATQNPDRLEPLVHTAVQGQIDRQNRMYQTFETALKTRKEQLSAERRLLFSVVERPAASKGQLNEAMAIYQASLLKLLLAENSAALLDVEGRLDPTGFYPSSVSITRDERHTGRSHLVSMVMGVLAFAALLGLLASLITQSLLKRQQN